jgi:hypothetical protein
MVIGQNGPLGVALTNNIQKLGLEDVTIQLHPMEEKIAHLEKTRQLNSLIIFK